MSTTRRSSSTTLKAKKSNRSAARIVRSSGAPRAENPSPLDVPTRNYRKNLNKLQAQARTILVKSGQTVSEFSKKTPYTTQSIHNNLSNPNTGPLALYRFLHFLGYRLEFSVVKAR